MSLILKFFLKLKNLFLYYLPLISISNCDPFGNNVNEFNILCKFCEYDNAPK